MLAVIGMALSAGAASWITNSPMAKERYVHTATLLPDGRLLVAGGFGNHGVTNTAELYDQATGKWTMTGALNTPRAGHTATLLPNGKVLVAGGERVGYVRLSTAELYDPATGLWTFAAAMSTNREYHTATLLPNGKVLVAGGIADGSPTWSCRRTSFRIPSGGLPETTRDCFTTRRTG